MADGLTVPFALAAGLAGRFPRSHHHYRGSRRVAAGALAWGSAAILPRARISTLRSELQREKSEIKEVPETERAEVRQILRKQGLDPALAEKVTEALTRDPERWIHFMMRFELGLEEPCRAANSKRLEIGGAYVVGVSFPYCLFFLGRNFSGASALDRADLAALLIFGGIKGK